MGPRLSGWLGRSLQVNRRLEVLELDVDISRCDAQVNVHLREIARGGFGGHIPLQRRDYFLPVVKPTSLRAKLIVSLLHAPSIASWFFVKIQLQPGTG